jgi:hypothetical protein
MRHFMLKQVLDRLLIKGFGTVESVQFHAAALQSIGGNYTIALQTSGGSALKIQINSGEIPDFSEKVGDL